MKFRMVTVHTIPECKMQDDVCGRHHFVDVPAISRRGTFKFGDLLDSQSLLNLHIAYTRKG